MCVFGVMSSIETLSITTAGACALELAESPNNDATSSSMEEALEFAFLDFFFVCFSGSSS